MEDQTYMMYFLERTTPQEYLLIQEAERILEKKDRLNYIFDLEILLNRSEDMSSDILFYEMLTVIKLAVINAIKEYDVILTEDATFKDQITVLNFLSNVQELTDTEYIEEVLFSNMTPNEMLAEMIGYYSIENVERLIPIISSVSVLSLTQLIYKPSNTPQRVSNENYYKRLKQFNDFSKVTTIGVLLVRNGIILGQSFGFYFNKVKAVFNQTGLKGHELDIYSLVLLTNIGNTNPMLVLKDFIDTFIEDEEFSNNISKIDQDFNIYLKENENEVK